VERPPRNESQLEIEAFDRCFLERQVGSPALVAAPPLQRPLKAEDAATMYGEVGTEDFVKRGAERVVVPEDVDVEPGGALRSDLSGPHTSGNADRKVRVDPSSRRVAPTDSEAYLMK